MKYYCKQCKKNQNFKQMFYRTRSGNKYPLKTGPRAFVVRCNVCGWRWWTSNDLCVDRVREVYRVRGLRNTAGNKG